MLNKPITLALILMLVTFFVHFELTPFFVDKPYMNVYLTMIIPVFLMSLYMGVSHVKTFKTEMPTANIAKIGLYYFIIYTAICLAIIGFLVMNTTVKDVALFDLQAIRKFLPFVTIYAIYGLCVYWGVRIGCRLMLGLNKEK